MKKPLHIVFILVTALILLAADGRAQEPVNSSPGIVSVPLANVHEEPVPKSPLETQVLMGDEVRVLEKRDNRYRITIPGQENREGWIQQEAVLIPKDKGRFFVNSHREWIVITSPKSEVMILDKTGNHKVSLYAGTRLPVLQTLSDGLKIQFPDKTVAILNASDAMRVKSSDLLLNNTTPEEIAKTAKQFVRVRSLSGGYSAQGIDIHGLIALVYRIHGIPLSTDREWLQSRARRISKKELEPGDILVFHGEGLGLHLGGGRFLQVPRKTTVQIAGIHDRRFANSLQYGLRILGMGQDETKNLTAMTADEILLAQARAASLPIGKRIVYWAGRMIGVPYDPDPLGYYVRTNRVVADEKADCMYHVFRSVELAQSATPGEAVQRALSLRFITQGRLVDGLVANYDERYQYGEDMVFSGKWGKNITGDLGAIRQIPGSRGKDTVDILPKNALLAKKLQKKFQDGDIVFWVKDPKKRGVEEIVSHLSIIRIKSGKPYLIHASGDKDRPDRPGGGVVKEVPFGEYVRNMKFIGSFVTRFEN